MAAKAPRLSIGVPVYNGARFVGATLDSILAQTWTDFELIICDNGSTDSTPQICAEYERRDPRVRVWRSPVNLGPSANYNKCFELARGELFKWQAADDTLDATFLEKCVAELDANLNVVSVYSRLKRIDENGVIFGEYPTELDLGHPNAARRLWRYIFVNHRRHHAAELWGVMRTSALKKWVPLKGSYPSADRVMMSRVVMSGPLKRVEEYLFFDRSHSGRSEHSVDRAKVRGGSRLARRIGCGPMPPYQWWDSSKKGKIVFPEFRWVGEYLRGVFLVPLSFGQRLGCLATVACLAVKFIPRFARDLLIAVELGLYKLVPEDSEEPVVEAGSTSP
jgi:glycosyltransferase involved in cell wall biosynthesis